MRRNIVVDVVPAVAVEILSSWLSISSLGRLDTAFCMRGQRAQFLKLLARTVLDTGHADSVSNISAYLEWHIRRKVCIRHLYLTELLLAVPPSLRTEFVQAVCSPRLTELRMVGLSEDSGMFSAALYACTSIPALVLAKCKRWAALTSLPRKVQASIRTLKIIDCGTEVAVSFERFHLPNLRELNLTGINCSSTVRALLLCAPSLTALTLWKVELSEQDALAYVPNARQLTKLSLHRCLNLTTRTATALGCVCKDLKFLGIFTCPGFVDSNAMQAFAANGPHLTAISLDGQFADDVFRLIGQHYVRLKQFGVKNCAFTSADAFLSVIANGQTLTNFRVRSCTGIPSAAFVKVLTAQARLVVLRLADLEIDDAVLEAIGKHCVSLKYLSLTKSRGFTEAGITAVAKGCGCLREVFVEPDHSLITAAVRARWQEKVPRLVFMQEG